MFLKTKQNKFAVWILFIGIIAALAAGILTSLFFSVPTIISYSSPIYAILVLMGLLAGFTLNISRKQSQMFLIVLTFLVVVSRFGMDSIGNSSLGIGIGDTVTSTFSALLALLVPATIIVALKSVFSLPSI